MSQITTVFSDHTTLRASLVQKISDKQKQYEADRAFHNQKIVKLVLSFLAMIAVCVGACLGSLLIIGAGFLAPITIAHITTVGLLASAALYNLNKANQEQESANQEEATSCKQLQALKAELVNFDKKRALLVEIKQKAPLIA